MTEDAHRNAWNAFLREQGGRFTSREDPNRLTSFGNPEAEAKAAATGSILVDATPLARVLVTGPEAKTFLHRLTTNDIESLSPGEGAYTLFLTPKGRVLDLVLALVGEEEILLIGAPSESERIQSWLERYLFREKVLLSRVESEFGLGIYGKGAAAILQGLAGAPLSELPATHHRRVRVQDFDCRLVRSFPLGGAGYLLFGPASGGARLWKVLAERGCRPAGEEALERLRLEAGVPAPGKEISQEYNPWEIRMDQAISLTKGCYLGQEVVARLLNYDKIQKRLAGLLVESFSPPPRGCPVFLEGREVGQVTSSAPASEPSRSLALALLQLPHPLPDSDLRLKTSSGEFAARCRPLPFCEGTDKL